MLVSDRLVAHGVSHPRQVVQDPGRLLVQTPEHALVDRAGLDPWELRKRLELLEFPHQGCERILDREGAPGLHGHTSQRCSPAGQLVRNLGDLQSEPFRAFLSADRPDLRNVVVPPRRRESPARRCSMHPTHLPRSNCSAKGLEDIVVGHIGVVELRTLLRQMLRLHPCNADDCLGKTCLALEELYETWLES